MANDENARVHWGEAYNGIPKHVFSMLAYKGIMVSASMRGWTFSNSAVDQIKFLVGIGLIPKKEKARLIREIRRVGL